MGGPMNFSRLMGRNGLSAYPGYSGGPPGDPGTVGRQYIAGELQRMRRDQILDSARYAEVAGTSEPIAAAILRAVLDVAEPDCTRCQPDKLFDRRCGEHIVCGVTSNEPRAIEAGVIEPASADQWWGR